MNRTFTLLLLSIWLVGPAFAQENFPINGPKDERLAIYAFTNATIVQDYQTMLEKATLLIKGEKIVGVGINLNIPKEAVVYDLKGKFIYPSFIDLHTTYGMPKAEGSRGRDFFAREQIRPRTEGAYNANDAIKSDFKAQEAFKVNDKTAKSMRNLGFGTVLTFREDGLARGTSALVSLSDEAENRVMLKGEAGAHYSLNRGSSRQMYPVSTMGFIALLRQTYMDAEWYQGAKNENFFDNTLEAWNLIQDLPQFFDSRGYLNLLRADKVGDEFGVQYIIKGSGDEYKRLDAIKATKAPLIIPVNFPGKYKVEDPYAARQISLGDMMHWEQAPANPARLAEKGIEFALTTHGLKKKADFWKNLRKAIEYGLSEEAALKALTYTPARLVQADQMIGSIRQGKMANFIISSGNIFSSSTSIYENWIQGKPFRMKELNHLDIRGNYDLKVAGKSYMLEIGGKLEAPKFTVMLSDSTKLKTQGSLNQNLIHIRFVADTAKKSENGLDRLSGWVNDKAFSGEGQSADGSWIKWAATQTKAFEAKKGKKDVQKKKTKPAIGQPLYPMVAYGFETKPKSQDMLIKNATVWTNEAEGIMEKADVLVKNGKIAQVGKDLSAGGAQVVDGSGKHLTSGVIDEHSHIALSSVNDVATVSSMVRMEDVVDPDDINIYRQLSGGVTAAQLLHGSANPVGGQSAIVKLRWGADPEEMLIKRAKPYIKFALGENVKRSRSSNSIRFPQTRMGVEQVYQDAFTEAKAYDAAWKAYQQDPRNKPKPRRDLALEAMAEILNGERFISCHSYVQSEINMLMKLAESFDFRVQTFTHILEGYKVADKMKAHGAGASTFSDWWAYKYEVYEAIPYGPILMHNEGVVVAINSDNAEMARRLNQEAAKAVKYGGMSEEDAWKMVTLNPAKLLQLDARMGSIKVGKDADLVLWSDNPLSIYARAEKTIIDGVVYYDLKEDMAKRKKVAEERIRLIQKMSNGKSAAAETPPFRGPRNFHCDDMIYGDLIGELEE